MRDEGLRILSIDDDGADRGLTRAVLRQELPDAEICEVSGAIEFAEVLGDPRWQAAIVERDLGWADGLEILDALKQRNPGCLTILFSAAPPHAIGAATGLGADAYVRKDAEGYLRLPVVIAGGLERARAARRSGDLFGDGAGDGAGPGAEREGALRTPTEALPVGYFWAASDGTILEANSALARLLGRPEREDLTGLRLDELVARGEPWSLEDALRPNADHDTDQGPFEGSVRVGEDGRRSVHACVWAVPDTGEAVRYEGLVWSPPPERARTHEATAPPDLPAAPDLPDLIRPGDGGAPERPEPLPLGEVSTLRPLALARDADVDAAREPVSHRHLEDGDDARIPGGEEELEPAPTFAEEASRRAVEPVPLRQAVVEAMDALRPLILAEEAKIRASSLPTLEANHSEMVRLFRELIENAIHFRAEEPPRIRVRAQEQPDGWLVSVRDNGRGIPADRLTGILNEAQSAPGHGLAIARQIANSYGGDLWLTSSTAESDRGTSVFATLKVRSAKPRMVAVSVRFNGDMIGRVSVYDGRNKREIARAALKIPQLQRSIGERTIRAVEFIDDGVVNIVA